MQVISNQTAKEKRGLWAIFAPSTSSLIISIVIMLAVIGGTLFITIYSTSQAPNFIAAFNKDRSSNASVGKAFDVTNNFLNGKTAFSDAPLAMFWALVGVGVYAIVIGLGSLIRNISETEHETQYVHIKREDFIRITLIRLLLRLLAIVLAWFVLVALIRYVFPYSIAAAHVASQGDISQRILYGLTSGFSLLFGLHALVVTVRLIWLRVRLFA